MAIGWVEVDRSDVDGQAGGTISDGLDGSKGCMMQALIIFDYETTRRVKMVVAGVGYLAPSRFRIFRDRDAWELRGSPAQCDLLEVACMAMDVVFFRIDLE